MAHAPFIYLCSMREVTIQPVSTGNDLPITLSMRLAKILLDNFTSFRGVTDICSVLTSYIEV